MFKKLKVELKEQEAVTVLKYFDGPPNEGNHFHEISLNELYKKIGHKFNYSNGLFTKNASHPPYLKEGYSKEPSFYPFEKFKEIGFADISSFGICNMGDLGHGVFADRDFEPLECFILYSGIISAGDNPEDNSDYSLKYTPEVELCVDAREVGNISRFIQHMPQNFEFYSEFNKRINTPPIPINKECSDYWQWRNLKYINIAESDVAWANLMFMSVPIEGIPSIVLFNTTEIKKGEQLGFSYGHHYWLGRNIKPALFDLQGTVISNHHYGYNEIALQLPIMKAFCRFPLLEKIGINKPYNASLFKEDLERGSQFVVHPVWFNHLAEPLSIFKLRELLIADNTIGQEFNSIENELVIDLRNILSSEFTVKMYARTPHKPAQAQIYDIVCHTNNLIKWAQLTQIIKSPIMNLVGISTQCLKLSQEVIFMNVPLNSMSSIMLTQSLNAAKEAGIFKCKKIQIPDGPTHNDPVNVVFPTTEEAIKQVLRHNPKLSRLDIMRHKELIANKLATLSDENEIKRFFNLIKMIASGLSDCSIPNEIFELVDAGIANADNKVTKKDIALKGVTQLFFKEATLGSWQHYPQDQLVGKNAGRNIMFFTMPEDKSEKANQFTQHLKNEGFNASLKKAKNNKPSVVVDLTPSFS